MKKVPENKLIETSLNYQVLEETSLIVGEDGLWIVLNEEQFNRIKTSFDSGKFKNMSEDESLADLCEQYAKEVRMAKWQRFVFEYPEDIACGMTFKEALNSLEHLDDLIAFVNKCAEEDEELQEEVSALADEIYDNLEKYEAQDKAIRELADWVSLRGFERGTRDHTLTDANDKCLGSLDIAWPFGLYGITGGFTKPLAVNLMHTTPELLKNAEELGYICFTDIEEFKAFVEKNYKRRK